MSDAGITASVQAKFTTNRVWEFSCIDGDPEPRVVTLNGVGRPTQKRERAERVTKGVDVIGGLNNHRLIEEQ